MALVQAHLAQAEWHALDQEFAKDYRPSDVLFALPWVLHGASRWRVEARLVAATSYWLASVRPESHSASTPPCFEVPA